MKTWLYALYAASQLMLAFNVLAVIAFAMAGAWLYMWIMLLAAAVAALACYNAHNLLRWDD